MPIVVATLKMLVASFLSAEREKPQGRYSI
jgi:hypothetical protein